MTENNNILLPQSHVQNKELIFKIKGENFLVNETEFIFYALITRGISSKIFRCKPNNQK